MDIQKTQAVVIRRKDSGDSSLIVHVLTENNGRLILVAKGARSPKSKWRGSLEPYRLLEIQYYHKKDRPWQLLSSSEILENFSGISSSPDALLYAAVLQEIIDRSQLEEGDPLVFKLLLHIYRHLHEGLISPRFLHWYFIFIFLKLNGFALNIRHCSRCGKVLDRAVFNARDASLQCGECPGTIEGDYHLDRQSLHFLDHMEQQRVPGLADVSMHPTRMNQFDRLFWHALGVHFDNLQTMHSLKLLNILDSSL